MLDHLLSHHDLALVGLAGALCVLGNYVTVLIAGRVPAGARAGGWPLLIGLCGGTTAWSTHFIAMLAYRLYPPGGYDLELTVLSFVVGTALAGLGFEFARRAAHHVLGRASGGALVGMAVIALHYIGMAAMAMPGTLVYDASLVAVSVVLAIALGAGATTALGATRRLPGMIASGLLLSAMTLSMHFVAMHAFDIEAAVSGALPAHGVSRTLLAVAIGGAVAFILTIAVVGAALDVRLARRLRAEADRFRVLAEGAFEGLLVIADGRIVDSNTKARKLLALDDACSNLCPQLLERLIGDAVDTAEWGESDPVELTVRRADGLSFPVEVTRRRLPLPGCASGQLIAIRDVTARKLSEIRIAHLALHDPLTRLPNRRFFAELAERTIARCERAGERFAVMVIDLDNFKLVNDIHGHAAGDRVIAEVARRLAGALRTGDIVARFGGDEFALLLSACPQPAQATALAARIHRALAAPIVLEQGHAHPGASIGVAFFPHDGQDIEALLRRADTAMYKAKADGKATCRFFEAAMDAALLARKRLEERLRRAIECEQLTVAYQPIVDCVTRTPVACETLLRWHDEELGNVSPAEFIQVAEESGLVAALGEFVLRQACQDAAAWPLPLQVAVNVSALQFRRGDLLASVRAALAASGLPPARLELEITESVLIDNRDDVVRTLRGLKELGLRVAMDDFGTGFSSLSYLQSFQFDKLKIDRAFVADMAVDGKEASLVRAIVSMGRSLHMKVVAEGVETEEQAQMLRAFGCDQLQGYLLARPMPADAIAAYLAHHATHPPGLAAVG
ncbi:MAG: EAL domain-containing protein [Gammaproteobacteria bacterium]